MPADLSDLSALDMDALYCITMCHLREINVEYDKPQSQRDYASIEWFQRDLRRVRAEINNRGGSYA